MKDSGMNLSTIEVKNLESRGGTVIFPNLGDLTSLSVLSHESLTELQNLLQ
jgi:hypothetical protein